MAMEHLKPTFENQGLITAARRTVELLKFILVLLVVTEVFLTCVNAVNSFDFPWQFAEGTYLLQHGQPPHSILNAYGEISPNFQNEYIAYEFLIVEIEHVFGWIGLCVFFILLAFGIYIPCLWAFIQQRRSYTVIDICLFALGHFLINMRVTARPELIADICYVLLGMMLMRWTHPRWTAAQLLAVGLLFCVWSNVHGTFLLGGAMLALWYGQLFIFNWRDFVLSRDFRWMLPGVAVLIGCALNPFGFYRFIQPFQLHGLLWGQATSLEMWPVGSGPFLLTVAWTGIAIAVLLLRARDRKFYWLIAMLLLLQYLTFCSIRYNLFIALSLLLICWDGLLHPRKSYSPPVLGLSFALTRVAAYFSLVLIFLNTIQSLIHEKAEMVRVYRDVIFPKGHLANPSSLNWMIEHPNQNYNLLSYLVGGSIAQMTGIHGIHPIIDSGSHRYSDGTNEIYYYSLYSPDVFRRVLAKLNINAVAVNNANIYWAIVLNQSPDWQLVQIDDDSQLYLRKKDQLLKNDRNLFSKWTADTKTAKVAPGAMAFDTILRGINLRPDAESLNMLAATTDVIWIQDPYITYIREWLNQVPDDLIVKAEP